MKPMPKRKGPKENDISDKLREVLEADGWITAKTHGNRHMKGWPDLFCAHRTWGMKWVEMKRPGECLRASQVEKFGEWEEAGVDVFVVTSSDYEEFLRVVRGRANWHFYI